MGPALSAQSRALAISEYSRFSALDMSRASEVKSLAGANFAICRKTFASRSMPDGLVDHLVFDAIRELGGRIIFEPRAGVTYSDGPEDHVRLSTRFHHGRIYGGLFAAQRSLASRLRLALLALAVPIVLVMRNLRHAGPQLLRSPATLWWIVLMQCAWGCGEVVGKLTGKVGGSFKAWA